MNTNLNPIFQPQVQPSVIHSRKLSFYEHIYVGIHCWNKGDRGVLQENCFFLDNFFLTWNLFCNLEDIQSQQVDIILCIIDTLYGKHIWIYFAKTIHVDHIWIPLTSQNWRNLKIKLLMIKIWKFLSYSYHIKNVSVRIPILSSIPSWKDKNPTMSVNICLLLNFFKSFQEGY